MRVTYVSPYLPRTTFGAAGAVFLYHHIRRLAASGVTCTLVAPATPGNVAHLNEGPPGAKPVLFGVEPPGRSLAARAARLIRTAAVGLSPGREIENGFTSSPEVAEALRASDIVEVHWSEMLPLVPHIRSIAPAASVIAVEYDVFHQGTQRRARRARDWRARWLARLSSMRVRQVERKLLNACDAVLVFSAKDSRYLQRMGVATPVELVQPHIDPVVEPRGPGRQQVAVFVAAFGRAENSEGAQWLLDEIWPLVLAEAPQARLILAGADPPPSLLAQASEMVEITGFVPDLAPAYRAARVALAPLQTGAGVKFKVLQAMAHGLPVVATSVGAEGIVEESGAGCFGAVTDDPAEFAQAIVRCLTQVDVAEATGSRALAWVASRFEPNRAAASMLELYAKRSPR